MSAPPFIIFANNAATTTAGAIAAGATAINVASGTGALFPVPGSGQFFALTLSNQTQEEITYCTSRTGDVVTVTRGQEGTTALAWPAGTTIANLWTAGSAALLVQAAQLQQQAGNYAVDTGTANAYVITRTPTPASLSATVGEPIRVKIGNTNTGASTLTDSGLNSATIVNANGTALVANQLFAGAIYEFIYDGAYYRLMAPSISTGRLVNTQIFATAGTFTYTRSVNAISGVIWVIGAGGAGGGAPTTSAGQTSVGGGGGGGAIVYVPSIVLPATATVIVGAAGVANSGSSGGNGGSSAFGSTVANGGSGGLSAGPSAANLIANAGSGGTKGGTSLTDFGGNSASSGFSIATFPLGGTGGSSPLFAGAGFGSSSLMGESAQSAGAGGGGSSRGPNLSALPGGAGAPGIVIVQEYS